ncbi:MAG TPA: hypothetical protein VHW01_20800 [Polyangiaceae bacterium]|jgi:hypothetical protein|nr:hypothetical protein [Polyangiaceae bacterium]
MEKRSTMAASDAERAFQKLVKTLTSSDASIEAPLPTRREFGSNALAKGDLAFGVTWRRPFSDRRRGALRAPGRASSFDR